MSSAVFVLLAALLVIGSLLTVAYPIVSRARVAKPAPSTSREQLEELLAQREAAFQALRELTFDHRVGKITDDDFAAFEAHLKRVAAETLRGLDRWEAAADATLSTLPKRSDLPPAPSAGGRACTSCGTCAGADDKFCARCGSELPAATPTAGGCPACGQPFETGDRFCARCGQPLPSAVAQALP